MNRKYLNVLQENHLEISVNEPTLVRHNTSREPSIGQASGMTRQQAIKSLKSLDNVEEQESMIYGYGDDEATSATRNSFKNFP